MSLVRVNLLYMNIYGGILVLTVLCLRMLLKNRLPKRIFSILWCVALLRLLMPFSVNSSFGVFSIIQDRMTVLQVYGAPDGENRSMVFPKYFSQELYSGEDFGYNGGIGGNPGDGIITGVEGSLADNESLTDSDSLQGVWKLSRFRKISMAGTLVCVVIFLALYLNCLRRFKTALPIADPSVEQYLDRRRMLRKVRVRQSDRVFSPLTYGLVRPVILLPRHLEQENGQKLEYILQHEMVHICRFDGAWKLAMTAALCLHWFNPLVWVMYVFMNRDLELSCDEEVLRIFGAGARKGYALTLIGMEEGRHLPVPLYSGFGKNAVEERIGEIMKYKKKTKLAVSAGAALILAVVCMFATTSKTNENPSGADESLSEDIVNTDLPMDPPAGSFGETYGAGDNAGSGTTAGTENSSAGGAADTARREAENKMMEEEISRLLREAMEAENKAAEAEAISRRLLQRIIEASEEEDYSSIDQYFAEEYGGDIECLDGIREWKQETIRVWSHPIGDRCVLSIQVITVESEADSNDYLTVAMLKEGEDWKICFMGLEK